MKNKILLPCQVLVAGSGIAGVAAAISASRAKAQTILIEEKNYPGGIAVSDRHRDICGLYPANRGIAEEIIADLKKLSPLNKFIKVGKISLFAFEPGNLELVLRKLLRQEKNLKILFNSQVSAVEIKGRRIESVRVISRHLNHHLNFKIKPKAVIDATGCGAVIKLSHDQYQLAPFKDRQLAGFQLEIGGINDSGNILGIKVPYYLALAVNDRKLPAYARFTNFTYGRVNQAGIIKLNLPADNTSAKIKQAKKYATILHAYLRKTMPEFKDSYISWIAPEIHQREGLRLKGKYTLTEKDILALKKFSKPAARGYWPLEFWHPKYGQQIKYLPENKFYEIPVDCLKSKNLENLFAAGRNISVTPQALASTRVTGTCIYLGEAAGKLAAAYSRAHS